MLLDGKSPVSLVCIRMNVSQAAGFFSDQVLKLKFMYFKAHEKLAHFQDLKNIFF